VAALIIRLAHTAILTKSRPHITPFPPCCVPLAPEQPITHCARAVKLIELKQNPRASDHRVRATLKTFKKNYHDEAFAAGCRDIHGNIIGRGYGMNLNDRIKLLVEENGKQRSLLKEKTYELEALTSKYRKIQSMVQSGQFLQAINTSAAATSAAGLATAAGASAAAGSPDQQAALRQTVPGMTQSTSGVLPSSTALQATGCTSLVPPGAGMLTSRSPVRDRVSFSSTIGTVDHLIQPTVHAGGTKADHQHHAAAANANNGSASGGLRSCAMMSSITQITNTTTTSSTLNNTTDVTADLSSSKALVSGAATSSSSALQYSDKTPLNATSFSNLDENADTNDNEAMNLNERVQAISKQVAASRQQQRQREQQCAASCLKSSTPHKERHSHGDGRLVAMSPGEKQRLFRSQDDLSLFTILSYVKGPRTLGGGRHEAAAEQEAGSCSSTGGANGKLGQWLEGPFCTVLLRQTSWDASKQPRHAARLKSHQGRQVSNKLARFRKQHSHQAGASPPDVPSTKNMLTGNARDRLPRTLSMIEYLGLNDFDMIARRHDKILRYRRRMMAHMSCCASCSCCISTSHHQSSSKIDTNNNNNNYHSRAVISEGNMGNNSYFSSCDDVPLNYSDEFLQATSMTSCSTCCSLASQTYISSSELDYRHYHHGHHHHHNHSESNNNDDEHSTSGSALTSSTSSSSSSTSSSSTGGMGSASGYSIASSTSKSETSNIVTKSIRCDILEDL
jgi:hypothetical protein